jgi:hypothetical protein
MSKRVTGVGRERTERALRLLGEGHGVRAVAKATRLAAGVVSALAIVSGKGLERVTLGPDVVRERRATARLLGERRVKVGDLVAGEPGLGKSSLANLGLAWRLFKGVKRG